MDKYETFKKLMKDWVKMTVMPQPKNTSCIPVVEVFCKFLADPDFPEHWDLASGLNLGVSHISMLMAEALRAKGFAVGSDEGGELSVFDAKLPG
jgi:hypothetical protein